MNASSIGTPTDSGAEPAAAHRCSDVLAGTIAEMTWFEVDQASSDGAVLLWAFGVLEQHGPHLPAGTDVYLPSAHLLDVQRHLADRRVQALIVPPYYWGVNVVSASFPASYSVRPEVMKELMADIFAGVARDGFRHVFCFSGHGDALHNQTIHGGVELGRERTGMDVSLVVGPDVAARIGLELDDPAITLSGAYSEQPDLPDTTAATRSVPREGGAPPEFADVHAGRWETSMMMCAHPDLVREEVRATLEPTDLGVDELAIWRRGHDDARRTTPLGFFGDPAAATTAEGDATLTRAASDAAQAIEQRLLRLRT